MKRPPHTSRRDFLRMGTAAMASTAFLSAGACSPSAQKQSQKTGKFVYRTLGRTGLRVPVVSMGSIYAINLVRTALDEGIVYVHTSGDYSGQNHERLLGEVFRGLPRDSFVVASCPDLPYRLARKRGQSMDVGIDIDPKLIAESIDGSLQRLGLDYVDIYFLLSVGTTEAALHEPYLEAYAALKKAGKTRFAGIGTHENEPAVIRAAAESGFWDVVLTAYNFRQSHREEVRAAIGQAAAAGLGVVAMKTQAGVYWDPARTRKINMRAALKWVLQDENVHTTIPAFSNFEEMYDDLAVMSDLKLTTEEKKDLELGQTMGYPGHYCQQCGHCRQQCPHGLDIPTFMRSYMYAFCYGDPKKARETLRPWTPAEVACQSCRQCEVTCELGFDVKAKALDIARILDVPEVFLG